MIMAIDNIEQKCFNRTYKQEYDGKTSKAILRHYIPDHLKPQKKLTSNNDYDKEKWFDERHAYAKRQLEVIEFYAQDFKAIYNGLKDQPDIKTMLSKT